MSKETGGPAFPAKVSLNRDTGEMQPHQFGNDDFVTPGMSLRDYFAAKAMVAVIAAIMPQECHRWTSADFAREGYEIADAMLAERAK